MQTIMVFDLETIPDVRLGRRLLDLPKEGERAGTGTGPYIGTGGEGEASDKAVREALNARRLEQTQGNSSFLPHYLHQIVAISVVVVTPSWVKVWSLGEKTSTEKKLIERFFEGVEKYTPLLVSWNGGGFDLPVLHYRALHHGVVSARYWENGEFDTDFKWNNYLSRYHTRHTDLMEVLASYQTRAYAPLNEIALLLGLPGKMGMAGDKVAERYELGELEEIRNYCETDVLNTYLIFLRFQFIRGRLNQAELLREEERLKTYLLNSAKPHLNAFLEAYANEIKD